MRASSAGEREFEVIFSPSEYDYLHGACPQRVHVSAKTSEAALEAAKASPPPAVLSWEEPYSAGLASTRTLHAERTERSIAAAAKVGDPALERVDLLDHRFREGEQCLVLFLDGGIELVRMHEQRYGNALRWTLRLPHYFTDFVPPSEPGCSIVAMWRLKILPLEPKP